MRPVLSPAEARRVDEASGVPVQVLMERAGFAVALAAVEMGAHYGAKVVVLAGTGNNGGDGYVAARHLARRGVAASVHALGAPDDGSAAGEARARAISDGVPVVPLRRPVAADLVIDALFGTGFREELPEAAAAWAAVDPPLLAVDVPSGLDAATGRAAAACFRATRTATFHALKVGQVIGDGPDVCGHLEVVDIGLDDGEPALRLTEAVDAPRPQRKRNDHKWSVGSVLVVGGAPGMTGAALLAAQGALRSGAGAVAIAAPGETALVYATMSPDVLVRGLGAGDEFAVTDVRSILDMQDRYSSIVLGPGLGRTPAGFVDGIAAEWKGIVVLDADGINGVGGVDVLAARGGATVLTPHAGEFARLTGTEATPSAAEDLARETGCVVLLKGNPTIVAADETWIVDRGGPELATIGTGDVLAGMIGAFAAAGLAPEVAARSAAYHHGEAGRRLAQRVGRFTASELAADLGR